MRTLIIALLLIGQGNAYSHDNYNIGTEDYQRASAFERDNYDRCASDDGPLPQGVDDCDNLIGITTDTPVNEFNDTALTVGDL